MNIRSICAVAAVAVGVGTAADAAIFHYGVTYDSTTFQVVSVYADGGISYVYKNLDADDSPWALPLQHPDLRRDKLYHLRVVTDGDDVVFCKLAGFDCGIWNDFHDDGYQASPLVFEDEYRQLSFSEPAAIGVSFYFSDRNNQAHSGIQFSGEGYYGYADARNTKFTVVDMAPVPLPASAALLPLGIGVFAMMRKRRRHASA